MDTARVYLAMHARCGHLGWWPADGPLEMIVGAILTQNTAWGNVEKALVNLKRDPGLSVAGLAGLDPAGWEQRIRPAGYFRQKGRYLRELIGVIEAHEGGLAGFLARPDLRETLLSLRGIGPETADSICLYAAGRLEFVIDSYTLRIMGRLEVGLPTRYGEAKAFFESRVEPDLGLYQDYHAQFVMLGKEYCRPRRPKCSECPLDDLCEKIGIGDH